MGLTELTALLRVRVAWRLHATPFSCYPDRLLNKGSAWCSARGFALAKQRRSLMWRRAPEDGMPIERLEAL